jgi:Flp pilus assembly pilin Flp
MTLLRALLVDEDGATLVEYALIVSLLAVSSITALVLLSGNLNTLLNNLSAQLAAHAIGK